MSHINFTKIEQLIDESLRKMSIERLLYLADVATNIGQFVGIRQRSEENKNGNQEIHQKQKATAKLYTNLLKLSEKDSKIYAKIQIKKSSVDRLIEKADSLTEQEWVVVRALLEETNELMKQYYPHISDEDLIENEIQRHINKRLNINEKWLPLQ